VVGAHRSMAHRRSHARDLAAMAREARGGDGDLYPGWHEMAEGLGRPGDGGSRCRGEERRGAVGAVWRGGDRGTFYRGGEAVVGRGDGLPSGGRRCAIKAPISVGRRQGNDDSWGN
jgi:hypothetical protein